MKQFFKSSILMPLCVFLAFYCIGQTNRHFEADDQSFSFDYPEWKERSPQGLQVLALTTGKDRKKMTQLVLSISAMRPEFAKSSVEEMAVESEKQIKALSPQGLDMTTLHSAFQLSNTHKWWRLTYQLEKNGQQVAVTEFNTSRENRWYSFYFETPIPVDPALVNAAEVCFKSIVFRGNPINEDRETKPDNTVEKDNDADFIRVRLASDVVYIDADEWEDFHDGFAIIRKGKASAIIDRNGRFFLGWQRTLDLDISKARLHDNHGGYVGWDTTAMDISTVGFKNGFCFFYDNVKKKHGFFNTKGGRTYTNYHPWGNFDEKGYAVLNGGGYIDTTGKKVSRPVDNSDYLTAARAEDAFGINKWGYRNRAGKWTIPAQFEQEPGPFINGLARIITQDEDHKPRYSFVDRTGKTKLSIPAGFVDTDNKLYAYTLSNFEHELSFWKVGQDFDSKSGRWVNMAGNVYDYDGLLNYYGVRLHLRDAEFIGYESNFLRFRGKLDVGQQSWDGFVILNPLRRTAMETAFPTGPYDTVAGLSKAEQNAGTTNGGTQKSIKGYVDWHGMFRIIIDKDLAPPATISEASSDGTVSVTEPSAFTIDKSHKPYKYAEIWMDKNTREWQAGLMGTYSAGTKALIVDFDKGTTKPVKTKQSRSEFDDCIDKVIYSTLDIPPFNQTQRQNRQTGGTKGFTAVVTNADLSFEEIETIKIADADKIATMVSRINGADLWKQLKKDMSAEYINQARNSKPSVEKIAIPGLEVYLLSFNVNEQSPRFLLINNKPFTLSARMFINIFHPSVYKLGENYFIHMGGGVERDSDTEIFEIREDGPHQEYYSKEKC